MRKNLIALSLFNAAKLLREQEEGKLSPEGATVQSAVPTGKGGEPLTVESMIQRLNVIRAGKSFDDPEVFGQLTTLYKELEDEKKTWLDGFLFNIGRIVQSVSEKPTTAAKPELPAGPPAEVPPPAAPEVPPATPPAPAAV